MAPRFRKVLVAESGKDYSALAGVSEQGVEFACIGYEQDEERSRAIARALEDFDPLTDGVVPVGRTNVVAELFHQIGMRWPDLPVTIGIWKEGDYLWQVLPR